MSQLLVSIKSVWEAQVALQSAADIIDIKDPSMGSLGMADPSTITGIVRFINGQRPLSVALGELRDVGDYRSDLKGVSYGKVGLSRCVDWPQWPQAWREVCCGWSSSVRRVAVAYADESLAGCPSWRDVLAEGVRLDCRVFMFDTYDKSQGHLLDWLSVSKLRDAARAVKVSGMQFALAGSLTADDISMLAPLVRPDIFAVRTAACRDGRLGQVSQQAIDALSVMIDG